MTKPAIRAEILAQRNTLKPDTIETCQNRIFENVLSFHDPIALTQASFIMCYSDFRGEVKTERIREFCFSHDIQLCLPVTRKSRTAGRNNHMDAYIVTKNSVLVPDPFGVPIPDITICEKAKPENIEIIFVPGIAFDVNGNRLGFGKGYYDVFLPKAPNALKIALAYEFQIRATLPAESWDVRMDYIVTEKRIINCSTGSSSIMGKKMGR